MRVNCFAVPFGYVNDEVREFIMKAGFEALFTVYGQHLGYTSPNNSLGRYLMEGNKPKVFSDALNFGSSAGTGAAPVAEVATGTLSAQPAEGSTITPRSRSSKPAWPAWARLKREACRCA